MSKFNRRDVPTVGPKSAVQTLEGDDNRIRTGEGYRGYKRTAKSDLFLLAASFMGGDDNFYEKESDRYRRLIDLVGQHEVYGDLEWLYKLVGWLRNEANMRTVAGVIAVEAVRYRILANATEPVVLAGQGIDTRDITNRNLIDVACSRADEPAEILAYWLAKHGKPIPQPIKNGVGDAAVKLYTERAFLKYGSRGSAAVDMRDVIRMTHPTPKAEWQNVLFEWITHKNEAILHRLPTITTREWLYSMPKDARLSYLNSGSDCVTAFQNGGMTWENVSEWSPEGMSARMWEAIIPSMGIMALIRNLRNFDQAGIGRDAVRFVQDKIADPEVVANSRQLPFRWYNAYRAVESVRWADALDQALTHSVRNVPKLRGRTLVLVDMSGSMMQSRVSAGSDVRYVDVAALFGCAWKLANPDGVDLWQFGSDYRQLTGTQTDWLGRRQVYMTREGKTFDEYGAWEGVAKRIEFGGHGGSILRAMEKFHDMGGTEIHKAVAQTMTPTHDRLLLITDEQAHVYHADVLPVPDGKDVYIWNLGGYGAGVTSVGKYHRHSFGGLNDNAFKLIPILEAGKATGWPWEIK